MPSRRTHEIGQAEKALAAMESALARELKEKKHLAALDWPSQKSATSCATCSPPRNCFPIVSPISHDPLAKRLAPKLIGTLDRAIRFCQATLAYGRAARGKAEDAACLLHALADEAIEGAVPEQSGVEAINDVRAT